MKLMITVLCLVALVTPACATDTTDDVANKKAVAEVVRTAVEGVLSVLKNEQFTEREKRKRVMSIIEPVVDLRLMARLSLDTAQWRRLSKEQRRSFTDLFIEDLKRSYCMQWIESDVSMISGRILSSIVCLYWVVFLFPTP